MTETVKNWFAGGPGWGVLLFTALLLGSGGYTVGQRTQVASSDHCQTQKSEIVQLREELKSQRELLTSIDRRLVALKTWKDLQKGRK